MSVKIGHARISENGTVNGRGGDQTGSEVCISRWYKDKKSGDWKFLLRPMTSALAEKSAVFCEKVCENPNVGYGQLENPTRNTLHWEVLKVGYDHPERITAPCNCDCSSFMQECAEAGGAKIIRYGGNAQTTVTMETDFPKSGVYAKFYDKKYLNSDKYLRRGDILVSSGHTVMVLEDGKEEQEVIEQSYMIVNGEKVPVERILKNGTNYIKIRDIASALNLEVGYKGSIATLDSKDGD